MQEKEKRLTTKRLLTDKEFDEYIKLIEQSKQRKYLEKLREELWQIQK